MSNRRRRQERLSIRKQAWYRSSPRVVLARTRASLARRIPRRTVAIVVALLVVAGGTIGLAVGLSGGSSYHPVSFRIVYRVTDGTTTPHQVTTQILDVRRPLYAALLTRSGPPPGGALTAGSVEDANYVQLSQNNGTLKAQQLQPDIATSPGADLRLQPALDLAAAAGDVRRTSDTQVAGRSCTQFESHDPLDSGNWKLPSSDSQVTSCVDADGHMLSDNWLIKGKLVRERVAVSFESNPKPLPNPLAGIVVDTNSAPLGITSAPLSNKVSFQSAIPRPPSGMRRIAARLVGFTDPSSGSLRAIARNLLFSNGDDFISVREQRSLGEPVTPASGPAVPVGMLGTGHLSYTPQGLAITINLDQMTQLRVLGTVSQDQLVTFAKSVGRAPAQPTPSASPS